MNHPLISIIIPVYNAEKFLDRTVESCLVQSGCDFEVILVNDGSTDGSGKLCDEYVAAHPHFRVVHKPNGGISTTRNAGIENAKGEFLLFVDSDDWIEPTHIETLLPVDDEDMVYGGRKMFVNSNFVEERTVPDQVVVQQEWLDNFTAFAGRGLIVFFCSPCYRIDVIRANNVRFRDGLGISEDGLFNLALMKHCRKIRYSNSSTYCYEDGDETTTSLSRKFHPNRMQASMEESKMIESITGKSEYMMRFQHWKVSLRHYRHWVTFKNGLHKQEARKLRTPATGSLISVHPSPMSASTALWISASKPSLCVPGCIRCLSPSTAASPF